MKRHHSGIRNEYTENLRSQVTACSFLSVQMITNHLRFARFKIGHTRRKLPDAPSATSRFNAYLLIRSWRTYPLQSRKIYYTSLLPILQGLAQKFTLYLQLAALRSFHSPLVTRSHAVFSRSKLHAALAGLVEGRVTALMPHRSCWNFAYTLAAAAPLA